MLVRYLSGNYGDVADAPLVLDEVLQGIRPTCREGVRHMEEAFEAWKGDPCLDLSDAITTRMGEAPWRPTDTELSQIIFYAISAVR